jgi:galactitol-specific phosphotransferase system IIC component
MLTGGIAGFCIGIVLGLAAHTDWQTALWHACASAAVLGLLTRWWGRFWVRSLQASLEHRRAAESPPRPQTPSPALAKK